MNKNPIAALLGIFNKFTIQQKVMLVGAFALSVVMLGVIVFFLNEPSYSTLYTNLAEEDASRVIEYLVTEKIPYQLDNNGSTVRVPKDKLYETRLSLAAEGIPNSGVVGYEIFDKNTMGMSEFMQKLNYKRALEGEIARTIMQQDGIEGVRVHIVTPQKSIFKDEEKLPTASVVLKLKKTSALTKTNIAAIVNLVSSSIEGLVPEKVTVIDTKGRLLTNNSDSGPVTSSSSRQYEIKQSVETYLAAKAQLILDNVLGMGNSMVQVNADINFDQVEKTMETYDPESQVAVSEQTIKTENNLNAMGDSTAQLSENATVNYEISKTIQHVIEGSGTIKRLSVAAVINDGVKEVKKGENVEQVSVPREPEQMKKLEDIIKNAIGLVPERNDQFSIVNISFEPMTMENFETYDSPVFWEDSGRWINLVVIIAAIAAAFFILKGIMNKVKNERIMIGTLDTAELPLMETPKPQLSAVLQQSLPSKPKKNLLPLGDIEDEISDEAAGKKIRQDKIVNYVSKNPVDAAKLINAWLHEDEL